MTVCKTVCEGLLYGNHVWKLRRNSSIWIVEENVKMCPKKFEKNPRSSFSSSSWQVSKFNYLPDWSIMKEKISYIDNEFNLPCPKEALNKEKLHWWVMWSKCLAFLKLFFILFKKKNQISKGKKKREFKKGEKRGSLKKEKRGSLKKGKQEGRNNCESIFLGLIIYILLQSRLMRSTCTVSHSSQTSFFR